MGIDNNRWGGGVGWLTFFFWQGYIQLTANFSCQDDLDFPVPGDGSEMPVFYIKEYGMLLTFAMENTAFSCQVTDEVTAFHGATLEPGFFSSGFPHFLLCLSVPAGFPVLAGAPLSGFPPPL